MSYGYNNYNGPPPPYSASPQPQPVYAGQPGRQRPTNGNGVEMQGFVSPNQRAQSQSHAHAHAQAASRPATRSAAPSASKYEVANGGGQRRRTRQSEEAFEDPSVIKCSPARLFVILLVVCAVAFIVYSWQTKSFFFASSDSSASSSELSGSQISSTPGSTSLAFDSDPNSVYTDGTSNAWIGLSFASSQEVTKMDLYPQASNINQFISARVEVDSNPACTFSGPSVTTVLTISSAPAANQYTSYPISVANNARCVRLISPNGLFIADLKFFGAPLTATASSSTGSGGSNPGPTDSLSSTGGGAGGSGTGSSSAGGCPTCPNLIIDNVYVTQAIQNWTSKVPLVINRQALVRVFVRASVANSLTPTVRVSVYDGVSLIQIYNINAPGSAVPTTLSEGTYSSTWNVLVPAANVRTNFRVLAQVDPTNSITESDETDNYFPRSGTAFALTMLTAPSWSVRIFPVIVASGTVPTFNASNLNQWLVTVRKVWPLNAINVGTRATLSTSTAAGALVDTGTNWLQTLEDVDAARTADLGGTSTVHYYGVVWTSYTSGVAGLGYRPGRSAVGWDKFPTADPVAAHEWGHNFNIAHAPCGGVSGADTSYPYSGATIGMFGWNSDNNAIIPPTWTDIMAYCGNQWISDYNWIKAGNYRLTSNPLPSVVDAVADFDNQLARPADSLLVWGSVNGDSISVNPAFRVARTPSIPAPLVEAQYEVLVYDASEPAVLLQRFPFVTSMVSHPTYVGGEPEAGMPFQEGQMWQFSLLLPWSDEMDARAARITVEHIQQQKQAGHRNSKNCHKPEVAADPAARVTRPPLPSPRHSARRITAGSSCHIAVHWDHTEYPMAMARSKSTGEVLAFMREPGSTYLEQSAHPAEIVFSDGIKSVVHDPASQL